MQGKGLLGQYAGLVSRVTALILDLAIATAVILVLYWVIALPIQFFLGLDPQSCLAMENVPHRFTIRAVCRTAQISMAAITVFTLPVYTIFFFVTTGQTIGMGIMGLRVVRMDGQRMTLWRSILRYVGMILSLLPLGLGYLWAVFDDRRQTWHDKLAGTCIVYAWEATQNEFLLERTRRFVTRQLERYRQYPSAPTFSAVGHDLVTIAFREYNQIDRTLDRVQEAINEGKAKVQSVGVFVKDSDGAVQVLGIANPSGANGVRQLEPGELPVPATQLNQVVEDVPSDSFAVAVILDEAGTETLLKMVTRSVAGYVRTYNLDESSQPSAGDGGLLPAAQRSTRVADGPAPATRSGC